MCFGFRVDDVDPCKIGIHMTWSQGYSRTRFRSQASFCNRIRAVEGGNKIGEFRHGHSVLRCQKFNSRLNVKDRKWDLLKKYFAKWFNNFLFLIISLDFYGLLFCKCFLSCGLCNLKLPKRTSTPSCDQRKNSTFVKHGPSPLLEWFPSS